MTAIGHTEGLSREATNYLPLLLTCMLVTSNIHLIIVNCGLHAVHGVCMSALFYYKKVKRRTQKYDNVCYFRKGSD